MQVCTYTHTIINNHWVCIVYSYLSSKPVMPMYAAKFTVKTVLFL